MGIFGSNQDSSHENQAYADFMRAHNLTQNQINDLKNGIFEHIRSLHETFQNTQSQSAASNNTTASSLSTWAPEIAKIGLLGTLMTLVEKHTREAAASLVALNNHFNPAGSEQRGFTSNDKPAPKKEMEETNSLLKDLGLAIRESKPGQMVKGIWDELLSVIGLAALAVLVVPFIGPLVEWFDKNFGTNIKSKFDNLMEPFQGYVKTVKDTFNKITSWLEQLMTDPKEAFSQAVETIKNIGQYLWKKIEPGFNIVKNVMIGAYEYLKEKIKIYYDQFVNFLTGKPGASNVFDEAYEKIKGFWDSFMQSAEKFMTDMDLKSTFDQVKNYLSEFWEGVKVFGKELSPTLDETKGIFTALTKTIKDIWDSGIIQKKIEEMMNTLVDKVKGLATSLYETVVDSITNTIKKIFDTLVTRVMDEAILKMWGDPKLVPKALTPQMVLDAQKREREREAIEKEKADRQAREEQAKLKEAQEKKKQQEEREAKFQREHPELKNIMNGTASATAEIAKHTREAIQGVGKEITDKLEETAKKAGATVINAAGGSSGATPMVPIPTTKSDGVGSARDSYFSTRLIRPGL